ncbi:MAG: hypothetical protein JWQ19_3715 [Subtercola sp.]|nr:hypothetical protein [Subtercola sp.]
MAGKRDIPVPRPLKGSEYEIFFGSASAERGWGDLKAVAKNALADAHDYLRIHPALFDSSRCYRLKGDLAVVIVDGVELPQWQYKVTDGARIWYVVDEPTAKSKKRGRVVITRAVTGHPNETYSAKNFR